MNVYIQLTSAGVDTGPFSLYSDVDAYTSPFQTNISRTILLNGLTCTIVPASTTIIRVQSEDDCTNYIDITIQVNSTTTSTTSSTTTSTTTTSTSTTSTSTTTTTTTTSIPTTTTTTTTIPIQRLLIARTVAGTGEYEAVSACGEAFNTALVEEETIQVVYFQSASPIPVVGQQLFVDVALTTQFLGSDGTWWASITDWDVVSNNTYDTVVQIAAGSEVLDMVSCAGITTTTTTSSTTTTTTTTATPEYHVEMCVNDTIYSEINEVNIPYVLSPVLIHTPTKAGYNYLFFSIPIDRSFTVKDSLGADVTSDFAIDTASGISGVDIRIGYFNNYIYRSSSMYATSLSLDFTLTLS